MNMYAFSALKCLNKKCQRFQFVQYLAGGGGSSVSRGGGGGGGGGGTRRICFKLYHNAYCQRHGDTKMVQSTSINRKTSSSK